MNRILMSLALLASLCVSPAFAHEAHQAAAPETTAVTIGDLEISGAFTRATLPNAPVGAGYLVIFNNGAAFDRLVAAKSDVAGMTQIHEMKMEGDVMKMNELKDGIVIPAGGSVALTPGGLHIMFMQLKSAFVEGSTVPVTLVFEHAGEVTIDLAVGAPNAGATTTMEQH